MNNNSKKIVGINKPKINKPASIVAVVLLFAFVLLSGVVGLLKPQTNNAFAASVELEWSVRIGNADCYPGYTKKLAESSECDGGHLDHFYNGAIDNDELIEAYDGAAYLYVGVFVKASTTVPLSAGVGFLHYNSDVFEFQNFYSIRSAQNVNTTYMKSDVQTPASDGTKGIYIEFTEYAAGTPRTLTAGQDTFLFILEFAAIDESAMRSSSYYDPICFDFYDDGNSSHMDYPNYLVGTTVMDSYENNVSKVTTIGTPPTASVDNDQLTNLSLKNGGTEYLNPAFAPETYTYASSPATIAFANRNDLTLTYAAGTNSTVEVSLNSTPLTTFTSGTKLNLTGGSNAIKVKVTDKNDSGKYHDYVITVNVTAGKTDCTLETLTATAGSFDRTFDKADTANTNYTVTVPYAITSTDISATKHADAASMTMNGGNVTKVNISNLGTNSPQTVTIIVTAEDPSYKTTYIVTVVHGAPSKDVTLTKMELLSPNAHTFTVPSVGGADTTYAKIPEGTAGTVTFSFQVTRALSVQTSSYRIQRNGGSWSSSGALTFSGSTASANVSIEKGDTVLIEITIIAEDTPTTGKYTFGVERGLSTDTSLKTLQIDEGGTINTLKSPYTHGLASGTTSIDIIMTGDTAEKSTISFVKPGPPETVLDTGTMGATFTYKLDVSGLGQGTFTYIIRVTARAGNSQDYELKLIRSSDKCGLSVKVTHDDSGAGGSLLGFFDKTDANDPSYGGMTFDSTKSNLFSITLPYVNIANSKVIDIIGITLVGDAKSTISIDAGNGFSNSGKTGPNNDQPNWYSKPQYNTYNPATVTATITVKAEDGKTTATYNISIYREGADTDSSLANIKIGDKDYQYFNAVRFDYNSVSERIIVGRNIDELTVSGIKPTSAKSTVSYSIAVDSGTPPAISGGYFRFAGPGITHTVKITVKAEDTTTSTYTLYIISADVDNTMQSIRIEDDKGNELTPTFNSTTNTYSLTVAYSISVIQILATPLNQYAVAYAGVNGGSVTTGTAGNTVTFKSSTLSVSGTNNFVAYVISDAKVKGTEYKIEIKRNAAQNECDLNGLSLINDKDVEFIGVPVFQASKISYSIRFDRRGGTATTESWQVTVSATAPSAAYSTINGLGKYTVTDGTITTITVTVTAENGTSQKSYTITITVKDDYKTITDITNDAKTITFPGTGTFNLGELANSVKEIKFNVTLDSNCAFASVYSKRSSDAAVKAANPADIKIDISALKTDGTVYTITIYAMSEANNQGTIYTFNFTRAAARAYNTLASLTVKDSAGNDYLVGTQAFSSTTYTYNIRVDRSVTELTIACALPTPGNGSSFVLKPTKHTTVQGGNSSFTITVKAENGVEQDYIVNVTCKDNFNTIDDIDNNIKSITFDDTKSGTYALGDIANSVKTINFQVTLNANSGHATVWYKINSTAAKQVPNTDIASFNVTIDTLGTSATQTITIFARSEYGTDGFMQAFTFTRLNKETDATLSGLSVIGGGKELIDDFKSGITYYVVRVDESVATLTSITPTPTKTTSSVSISPAVSTVLSRTQATIFQITVTAESTAQQTYTIEVYRANNNNKISDIKIDGTSIGMLPVVADKSTATITISPDYPFSKKTIDITVTLEDSTATAYGIGIQTLKDGIQSFEIYALSKYGVLSAMTKADVAVYKLEVKRISAATDSKLEGLTVTDASGNAITGVDLDPSFSSSLDTYTITLAKDFALTQLKFNAVATAPKTLSGDYGIVTLPIVAGGAINTIFNITVTAEDGNTKTTYKITVTKPTALSSDVSITSVVLQNSDDNVALSTFTFNKDSAAQTDITIPYTMQSGLDLIVTPTDSNATVTYTGTTGATSGHINMSGKLTTTITVKFQVKAPDGTLGTEYSIKITRQGANTEKYLQTLEVKTGDGATSLALYTHSTGNPISTNFTIRIDDIPANATVQVLATVPSGNYSSVANAFANSYPIDSGKSITVDIIVQAQDGSTQLYKITILRAYDDKDLVDITIDIGGTKTTLPISSFTLFSTGTYIYDKLPGVIYKIDKVDISVTLAIPGRNASVSGIGTKNLKPGEVNYLSVQVTAQDGVTKSDTYIIYLTRFAASTDNTLKSLLVKDDTGNTLLNLTNSPTAITTPQTIYVNRSVKTVDITAAANHDGASVSGSTGTGLAVTGGQTNKFTIYVTAEAGGTPYAYVVDITVKNDDSTIKDIDVTCTATINTVNFVSTTKTYALGTVPYDTVSIEFTFELNDAFAELYINGSPVSMTATYNLKDNLNSITVYAMSERGTKGVDYTFTITRTPANTCADLSSLIVNDDKGNPLTFTEGTFKPADNIYHIDIAAGITLTSVDIIAVAGVFGSQITAGNTGVQPITEVAGKIDEKYTITVTAESGATKIYYIYVTKGLTLSPDFSIKTVSFKDSDSKEYMGTAFNPSSAAQTKIDIPYATEGLYVTVTPNSSSAAVSGDSGLVKVPAGGNITVKFQVTAQNGTSGTEYTVVIYRAAANTYKFLDTLTIDNAKGGNLTTYSHSVKVIPQVIEYRVDDIIDEVIVSATVPNNGSSIVTSFDASYLLVSGGTKEIVITVEDEAGNKYNYTLKIQRANTDCRIEYISVDGVKLYHADFTLDSVSGIYKYNFATTIPHSKDSLIINAPLIDSLCKATVSGTGVHSPLIDGANTFTVQATAQDKVTKGYIYQITITRATVSNNADLSSLIVKNAADSSDIKQGTDSFDVYVNRTVTKVIISATAANSGAYVSGELGQKDIVPGKNTFKVFVTAEDGTTSKTYTINIFVSDTVNTIGNITFTTTPANAVTKPYTFATTTPYYDLGSVACDTASIRFTVTLDSQYATLYVNSVPVSGSGTSRAHTFTLQEGTNTIEIYAMSEAGVAGLLYTYEINKTAASKIATLSDLVIKDSVNSNTLPFSEGAFKSGTASYTIILPSASTTTSVIITATPTYSGATVSGTGTFGLTEVAGVISQTFNITVTAEDGKTTQTYTVLIVRNSGSSSQSTDNSIKSVSLTGKGTEYMKSFNPSVSSQTPITVPYSVDEVFLTVTTNNSKATLIVGGGVYAIAPGETKAIAFRVQAENGDPGLTYYVDVTRELADSDNKLIDLYYEVNGTKYPLDVSQSLFYIDLTNSVSSIIIGGTKPAKATVAGFGTVDVSGVTTTAVTVTVTAENGVTKSYVLIITRKSDDATLKSIKIDDVENFGSFVGGVYTINIPYSQTSVKIFATANDSKAAVTGNGSHNMSVGANTIEIYATSELGTKGSVYTLTVNRVAASTNNYLSALTVKDTAGNTLTMSPTFVRTTQTYTIDLTLLPSISDIEIFATAESTLAQKVDGTGKYTLKVMTGVSSEIFTVTVTAEDGSTRKYDVTVMRNVNPDDDITIGYMSLTGSDSVTYLGTASAALSKFVSGMVTYNITVPYSVKNVTLTVTNANGASVTGNGNTTLSATGTTTVTFYLDSKSGKYTSPTYTIVITQQAPNTDSKLIELKIDGNMVDGFDPLITSYTITVSLEAVSSVVISAKANDINASVIGDLGTVNLSAGTNMINITVKAEDASIQTTYTLIIKRLSFDNVLKDLTVEDSSSKNLPLDSLFNSTLSNYTLTVVYSIDKIQILASANSLATITGTGWKNLEVGSANVFEVYATAQNGVKGKVYTITVTRAPASDDATLKSLVVYSGVDGQPIQLSPAFTPNEVVYILVIPKDSGINSFRIDAVANSLYNKGVGGAGYKILTTYTDGEYYNVFEIIVMAEDNSTMTYTITVTRNVVLSDDITVVSFKLVGSDGINYLATNQGIDTFYPNVHTYSITVPYSVESLTLTMTTYVATVYGNGTKVFETGNTLVFETYLRSQSGAVESAHYIITVTRTIANSNNLLSEIKINDTLISGFDPNTTQYNISIPYSNDSNITIAAKVADPTAAILSGTGSFKVSDGSSVYSIIVRAQDGTTRSYNLMISYLNENAFLASLSLAGSNSSIFTEVGAQDYTIDFNPEIGEYTIRVTKETKSLEIKGTAEDQLGSAIVGLGKYTLSDNENTKTITINVLSADRTTTKSYVVNIIREDKSTDSKLQSLTIGGYEIVFNPDTYYYTLHVDSSAADLLLSAIARDVTNAVVTIEGNKDLRDGRNAILVTVRAENGNTSVYQIVVTKDAAPDYFLTILIIVVFALWMLMLIILLYLHYRNNKRKQKEEESYRYNDRKRNVKSARTR